MNVDHSHRALRIAEHAEADALADLVGRTPAQARAALGLTAEAFADGVLVSMPHDPTDQWSRVPSVTRWTGNADDLVALARERFTRSGVRRASLQIAPAFEPDGCGRRASDWDCRRGRRS